MFIKNSEIKLLIDRLEQSHNLILDFKEKYENVKNSPDPVTYKELSEDLYNKIKELIKKYIEFFREKNHIEIKNSSLE